RLLLKLFQQATSGRPNPSIRTTSNDIPAATRVISSGQTGGCRFARIRLQRRRERRSRFHARTSYSKTCRGHSNPDSEVSRQATEYSADMLNDRVLPFFEEQSVSLLRVLSDRGSEYCGAIEHHEYQLYLALENIDHSKTKARHPQTNG